MLPVSSRSVLGGVRTILLIVLALGAVPGSWPQNGSEGTVIVSVVDPSGSVVQGAQLELRDVATNDLRKAETQEKGTHTFVNLSLGKYRLTIKKTGFQAGIYRCHRASRTDDRHFRHAQSRGHQRNRSSDHRSGAPCRNHREFHREHD